MTFISYAPKKFGVEALEKIDRANSIIDDYQKRGFTLTLRQLYYQFVQRGWLPNVQTSYNNLGILISDARLAGLVSWTAIEDRGRNLRGINTSRSPVEALKAAAESYRRDLWKEQRFRPEVWIEKEALVGVIGGICSQLRVDFFACKGYNSQSEQWRAGRRFADYINRGQTPIVFHLGDHDPSGLDMTRDNRDRLAMFAGVEVVVARLALNRHQIDSLNLPPNPAKVTDSRFEAYRRDHGDESWELDALDPTYIADLIRTAVLGVRDEPVWGMSLLRETNERRAMVEMSEEFGDK